MTDTLDFWVIDAFIDTLVGASTDGKNAGGKMFSGNAAAVFPLVEPLPAATMQQIAAEINLSETCFIINQDPVRTIRWFTPTSEVDLCGHATLAAGSVLLNLLDNDLDKVEFASASGQLEVLKQDNKLTLNFPNAAPESCEIPDFVDDAIAPGCIGAASAGMSHGWLLLEYADERQVRAATPDFSAITAATMQGVIITAPADQNQVDYCCRVFVPQYGIDEDPVTGSAQTVLAPYWSKKLDGRTRLSARQVSSRGGSLTLQLAADRVLISGQCRTVITGKFLLPV